jgi:predicted SAM-dependent methyltransferase
MHVIDALKEKNFRINFGCSEKTISPNFLNVGYWDHLSTSIIYKNPVKNDDALLYNIKTTEDLPLPDEVVAGLYLANLVDEIEKSGVMLLLKKSYRLLRPGGVLRISVPDARSIFDAYLSSDFSISEQFDNSGSRKKFCLNTELTNLLAKHPNLLLCDQRNLEQMLLSCGFNTVRRRLIWSSELPNIHEIERPVPFFAHHSLCLECLK